MGSDGGGAADAGRAAVQVPYERDSMEPLPLATLDGILEFDTALQQVTAGYPKPIRLGSILRLSEVSLANWGINVTPETRGNLIALANAQYLQDDTSDGPDSMERSQLRVFRRTVGNSILSEITRYISQLAKEFLQARDDGRRTFEICDLAAGGSGLCTAVAASLRAQPETEGILRRVRFHIVDYTEKLADARRNLQPYGAEVVAHRMTDEKYLVDRSSGNREGLDMVVLSCHTHRKPFISDYLASILRVMKPGAVLISGDWHSPLTHYPGQVYELLTQLGVDRARLDRFEELLGPFIYGTDQYAMDNEHRRSLDHHLEYWRSMSAEIGRTEYRQKVDVKLLSAFLTSSQLIQYVDRTGFETNREKIATAFPRAKLPSTLPIRLQSRSDTAAVLVGLKR